MLDDMQGTDARKSIVVERHLQNGAPSEFKVRPAHIQGPDIDIGDLAKWQNVSDEAVEAGADIDMPLHSGLEQVCCCP